MSVLVQQPPENFPEIGTVSNPAVFFDGEDAFICYEVSSRGGGGNVVLRFSDVIELRLTPMNAEGLKQCRYLVGAWSFNEVIGGEEAAAWKVLEPRFWLITFNDMTIEILFVAVSLVARDREPMPQASLRKVLET
ncbi:hypothetical protein OIU34_28420 [Pararhizobium sp. BT-229]|uniref:hypothetical protein n=1 Tax=Pararhizobium sp. BT-229 TaxID=2986923 RepID=UPI0021F6D786|nr:hypothetical protein [Pararhizobium sp. BT-229]MCV9965799.1 hypothetical protein [Pararhizobium sp. BT-229]